MTVACKKPEKVWGFTVASFFGLIGVFVAKYLIDFLVLPAIFPQFYPSTGMAFVLWLITSLVATVAAMLWITRFGYFYPVADIVYAIIMAIWPLGLYGTAEFWPAILAALAAAVILWVIQRLVLWIFIIVGFITM